MKYPYTLFAFLCLLLFSCNVAEKAYRRGDYDVAIDKMIRKLQHGKQKEKNIILLESAYIKVYNDDIEKINFLKSNGDPAKKPDIYYTYSAMRTRYNYLKSLLPLHIPSKNRDAVFKNVSDEDLIASKNDAADYLYTHASTLINTKDKFNARKAYNELIEVTNLIPDFRDSHKLIDESLELGSSKVWFKLVNASAVSLPPDFESNLLKINLQNLNSTWLRYYTKSLENTTYDYSVIANIKNIAVSPEQINRRNYTETKVVEDGWKYEYDEKGNVKKDTSGNDIKTINYKNIACTIFETVFEKHAIITGYVDYYDNRTKNLIRTIPFTVNSDFVTANATAAGDLNALTPASIQKLNATALPFPSDFDLLRDCSEQMKPALKTILDQQKCLIE